MRMIDRSKSTFIALVHGALISSAFLGFPAQANNKMISQQRAAKRVVENYFTALNQGDASSLVSLFHDRATYMADNDHSLEGQDNIRSSILELLTKINHTAEIQHSDIRINGNIAVVESETLMRLKMLDSGIELPTTDKDLFILVKIADEWKIDKFIGNGNTSYLDESPA